MRTVRISDDAQRAVVFSGYYLDTDSPPFREQPTRIWLADLAKNTIEVAVSERLQNEVDLIELFVWENLELSADGRIAVASGKQLTPHGVQSCCYVIDTMQPNESRLFMLGIDPIMGDFTVA